MLSGAVARRGATQTIVHPVPRISPSDSYGGRPSSMCRFNGAASHHQMPTGAVPRRGAVHIRNSLIKHCRSSRSRLNGNSSQPMEFAIKCTLELGPAFVCAAQPTEFAIRCPLVIGALSKTTVHPNVRKLRSGSITDRGVVCRSITAIGVCYQIPIGTVVDRGSV